MVPQAGSHLVMVVVIGTSVFLNICTENLVRGPTLADG